MARNGDRRGLVLRFQLFNDRILAAARVCVTHGTSPFQTRKRRGALWFPRSTIGLYLPLALGGCSGDLSALDPAGPYSSAIANLWWVMLGGATLIFALVITLFLLVIYRPGFGSRLSPRRWMILGGLALPIPVLLALMAYGMAKGEFLLGAWQNEPVGARIEARGSMWQWDFRYPDMAAAPGSSGTLHIPAGVVVELSVTSTDVIHSFWIPRLAGKIDAIPGHATRLRIKADTPGRYGGICAEYCGTGHTGMRFDVEAHPQESYRQRLTELTMTTAEAEE
ncbi:cytochrome c oxidase subunit II [Rhizobium glycinendophyticum]|uniref:Cytochrome aa3 subunit 2 n=1 Tax=Rhizobium glycinendophyticum TaxID=2589807 RepID=A0A504UJA0_9HYPH|nr:cytochrome c oxidase subunit II [Rhizobium glycinendophyticum]